jgi:amino acid adenylation domain-containing protein
MLQSVDLTSELDTLHGLVAHQVQVRPEAIAVEHAGQQLTYSELSQRSHRLAAHLLSHGIGNESRVGIHMPRSIEFIVAILAVLRAGGAYVPLDPAYPESRLSTMLEDADVEVVLTTANGRSFLDGVVGIRSLAVETSDLGPSLVASLPVVEPRNLAYVIFTSGTTGRPKGVMIEHRSAVSYIRNAVRLFGTRSNDRVLLFSSINFDASVEEIFAALASGATLVVRTDDMVSSIQTFTRALEALAITAISLPTAFAREMIAGMKSVPGALRYAVIGGEKAFPATIEKWRTMTCIPIWNTYGPTETTIAVMLGDVSRCDCREYVPLGAPMPGVDLHLLDAEMHPVAPGEIGELYFGGVQTARGYINRPDLTVERFVPSPFSPGQILYRTGDYARLDADGEYEYLGRRDDQIKIAGFRIELGEIEDALHEVAAAAKVVSRPDRTGEQRIVAYVVSDQPIRALKSHVASRVPRFMVPSAFVFLDKLPIGPGGKIARDALPEPDWLHPQEVEGHVGLHDNVERRIAAIWADVFGVADIAADSCFFELGGQSLNAIRIFTRIEAELGKSLPLSVLYQASSVAELAAVVRGDAVVDVELHPTLVPIRSSGRRPPVFCVGGGVINLRNLSEQLGPDQPLFALQWRGLTDQQACKGTLSEIAAVFVSTMRSVQPRGPYRLAGSFTAGMVAVEMARQLEEAGERIAMLAGFDAVVAEGVATAAHAIATRAATRKSYPRRIASTVLKGPRALIDHATNPYYREQLELRFLKIALYIHMRLGLGLPTWLRTGMGEELLISRITREHVPTRRFSGALHVFLTPQYARKYGAVEAYGWGAWVAGEVVLHEVSGEPCTIMLAPNVANFAAEFDAALRICDAEYEVAPA